VKLGWLGRLAFLVTILGCGGDGGGQGAGGAAASGGSGGSAATFVPNPSGQASFDVTCSVSGIELAFDVELRAELSRSFRGTESTEVAFSAAVTIDQETSAALIDAGIPAIDIVSMSVRTGISGASPSTITTFFAGGPIDDFDLTVDTDDDDAPGPHRLELEVIDTTATARPDATEVEFDLDSIAFVLGDFRVPERCFGFSASGVSLSFPVEPG